MKLVFLLVALTTSAFAQVPRIEVAQKSWDFGIAKQGETITKKIPVRNVGTAPLRLFRVKITCGCLNGWVEKAVLEPGEEGNVVVKLDTERRIGRIVKSVYVESNDFSNRRCEIRVEGEIRSAWWPSLRHVAMGRVERGAETTREFKIHVEPGKTINLIRATSSVQWFKVATEPFGEVDGDHGWIVRISLAKEAPMGRLVASLLLITDWKEFPRQTIAVNGEVVSAVTVAPKRIQFGKVGAGEKKTVIVTISRTSGDGLALKKIDCLDESITTKVVEKEPGAVYEVHVTAEPQADVRRLSGRLYVHTNLEFMRVIPLPYSGSIAR